MLEINNHADMDGSGDGWGGQQAPNGVGDGYGYAKRTTYIDYTNQCLVYKTSGNGTGDGTFMGDGSGGMLGKTFWMQPVEHNVAITNIDGEGVVIYALIVCG